MTTVKIDEGQFAKMFANAFHEVAIPVLEDMSADIKGLQNDVGELKKDMKDVKRRLGRVEDDVADIKDDMRLVKRTSLSNESRISRLEAVVG